jgi:anti-sigma factor (TIGR02949 family)
MKNQQDNPEILNAYMDGELSREEREKVKSHVQTCPLCGRELKLLQIIKDLLQEKIQIAPAPPALKGRIRLEIEKRGARPLWLEALMANLRAPAWGLLAVIILFMVIGWGYYQFRYVPKLVVQDIADRHIKCARGPIRDFYESTDAKHLESWYEENLAYRVSLPRFRDAKMTLMGGKRCRVAGMYMAHTVYTEGERRISLFALPQGTCSLRAFEKLPGNSELYQARDDEDKVRILFWRQGSVIYALVYEGELQRLKTLAESRETTL